MEGKEVKMKEYRVYDYTFLLKDNGDNNSGEVIITHPYYTYRYYWGAMGSNLEQFLKRIDSSYFNGCVMNSNKYGINLKATFANIRKSIQDEVFMGWYNEPAYQKEFRSELRTLQDTLYYEGEISNEQFVDAIYNFRDHYLPTEPLDRFGVFSEDDVKHFFDEPWYLIVERPTREYEKLKQAFEKFQKILVKNENKEKVLG